VSSSGGGGVVRGFFAFGFALSFRFGCALPLPFFLSMRADSTERNGQAQEKEEPH
jgi:hypothetical protein